MAIENINGATIVTGESLDWQRSTKYFCANGNDVTISKRADEQAGFTATWTFEGNTYSMDFTSDYIVCGGSWDGEVASANITVTGGDIAYGVFGGGATAESNVTGDVVINIVDCNLGTGVVGGGIAGSVGGNVQITVGTDATQPKMGNNIIGGGFLETADIAGNVEIIINDAYMANTSSNEKIITGGGVFADIEGSVSIVVNGGEINGYIAGGSMGTGNVGGTYVEINGGTVGYIFGCTHNGNSLGESGSSGDVEIVINDGTVTHGIWGGALYNGTVDNVNIEINGGQIGTAGNGDVIYAGANLGEVTGTTTIAINTTGETKPVINGSINGGDVVTLNGASVMGTIFVDPNAAESDVANDKYVGVNVVDTVLEAISAATADTTKLVISEGTYSNTPNVLKDESLLAGSINTVTTDGTVTIDKGNLTFYTTVAGTYNISGDYVTTGIEGYDPWPTWATSGITRFAGAEDVIFNIENANFVSSAAIQFIGGKAIIANTSSLALDPTKWTQMAVYGEVENYGTISLVIDNHNGSLLNIGHSSYKNNANKLTISGENASLVTQMLDSTEAQPDVNIHSTGTLIVKDDAVFDANGHVINNGVITVDAAKIFEAGILVNNGTFTIDDSTATFGTLTNNGDAIVANGEVSINATEITGNAEIVLTEGSTLKDSDAADAEIVITGNGTVTDSTVYVVAGNDGSTDDVTLNIKDTTTAQVIGVGWKPENVLNGNLEVNLSNTTVTAIMSAASRLFNGDVAFNIADNSFVEQLAVGLSATFKKDVTVTVDNSAVNWLSIANANVVEGTYTINLNDATIGTLEYGNGVTSVLNIDGTTSVGSAVANSDLITLAAGSTLTANGIALAAGQAMNIGAGASIVLNGAWNNAGTVTIDMTDFADYCLNVIDANSEIADFGTVNLENNTSYITAVVNNDLYVVDTTTILIGATEYDSVEHFKGITAFDTLEEAATYTEGARKFVYTTANAGEVNFSISSVAGGITTVIVDGKSYDIFNGQSKIFSFAAEAGDTHTFEFVSDTDYTFESTTLAANIDSDLTSRDWETEGILAESINYGGGVGDKVYDVDIDNATGNISVKVSNLTGFTTYQIIDENDTVLATGTSNTGINKTLTALESGNYKVVISGDKFATGDVEIVVQNTKETAPETLETTTPVDVNDGTLGGVEGEKTYEFTVAENTVSTLNLKVTEVTGFVTCEVFDAAGNVIYKGSSNTSINKAISGLAAGNYKIVLSSNTEVNFNLDMNLTVDVEMDAPGAGDGDNTAATALTGLTTIGDAISNWVGATDSFDWIKLDLDSNGYQKVALEATGDKVVAEVWRVAKGETDESAMKLVSSFNVTNSSAFRNINFNSSSYDYYVKIVAADKTTASTDYTITLK